MPSNTPSAQQLFQAFHQSLGHLRSTLLALDVETIARRSGFLRRCPRKIPMGDLALALLAVGTESVLSLERVAHWVSLIAGTSYSKQAFHKRLGPQIEPFLAELAATLFGSFSARSAPGQHHPSLAGPIGQSLSRGGPRPPQKASHPQDTVRGRFASRGRGPTISVGLPA